MKTLKLMIVALVASFSVASIAKADICVANDGVYVARFNMRVTQNIDLQASGLGEYAGKNPDPYFYLPNGDFLIHINGNIGTVWRSVKFDGAHLRGEKDCMPAFDLSRQYKVVEAPQYAVNAEFVPFPGIWSDVRNATASNPAAIRDGQTLVTHGITANAYATVE